MLNMLRMGPILNGTNTEWPKNDKSHSAGEKIIQDWVEKYDRRYHFSIDWVF
jgi:hypothetical protein